MALRLSGGYHAHAIHFERFISGNWNGRRCLPPPNPGNPNPPNCGAAAAKASTQAKINAIATIFYKTRGNFPLIFFQRDSSLRIQTLNILSMIRARLNSDKNTFDYLILSHTLDSWFYSKCQLMVSYPIHPTLYMPRGEFDDHLPNRYSIMQIDILSIRPIAIGANHPDSSLFHQKFIKNHGD